MDEGIKKFKIGRSYRPYRLSVDAEKRYASQCATLISRTKYDKYHDLGVFSIGNRQRDYLIREKLYMFSGVKGGERIEVAIHKQGGDPEDINRDIYGKIYSNEEVKEDEQ